MNQLERRLAQLEQQVHLLSISQNTISAPLRVVDGEGRTLLLIDSDGPATNLLLFDPRSQVPALCLTADPVGGGVAVTDGQGRPSVLFFATADGGAVELRDPEGEVLACAGAAELPEQEQPAAPASLVA